MWVTLKKYVSIYRHANPKKAWTWKDYKETKEGIEIY